MVRLSVQRSARADGPGLPRSPALWLARRCSTGHGCPFPIIEANVAEPRFLLLTAVRRTAPEPVLDTVLVEPRNLLEPD